MTAVDTYIICEKCNLMIDDPKCIRDGWCPDCHIFATDKARDNVLGRLRDDRFERAIKEVMLK